MIWFRRRARERERERREAEARLREAKELGKRTTEVADSIRLHMRRNDFGAMIDEALHGKAN
jgi:hypothetical protein